MMSTLLRTGALTACLFGASAVSAAEPTNTHYRAKQVLGTGDHRCNGVPPDPERQWTPANLTDQRQQFLSEEHD